MVPVCSILSRQRFLVLDGGFVLTTRNELKLYRFVGQKKSCSEMGSCQAAC